MSHTALLGSVAVVTGANGRLGPLWVEALLRAGANVLGLDLAATAGPALRAAVKEHGDRFALVEANVTDRAALAEALEQCLARFGAPDVLVNSAGVDQPPSAGSGTAFDDPDESVAARMLDVNSHGALRVCQVFGPVMAGRGSGSIINIGSLYGSMAPDQRLYDHLEADPPFLKHPAYGMSKAALAELTRHLAALWGREGVRVNTLSPGGVRGDQDAAFVDKFTKKVPLGRMAEGEDLAGPLVFLASPASRYVTGVELMVDGGFTCW